MQGIELLILYVGCLIGTIFWLRASETNVSKGFAIFFMVWSSIAVILMLGAMIGVGILTRRSSQ